MIMMSEQDNTAAAVDKDNDLILMINDIEYNTFFMHLLEWMFVHDRVHF